MTDNRGVFFLNEVQEEASTGDWVPLSTVFIQYPFDSSAAPNTGYFAGGPSTTVVDKVNYTNDTTARVPTADFPTAQNMAAASSSLTAGYFAGGNPSQSEVQKLTYASDTTARAPGADLSEPRHGLAGTGSSSAGYFLAGYSNPVGDVVTRADKLTYSADTAAAAPGADLSLARYYMEGTGDSSNGYVGGGYAPAPTADRTTLDKVIFSSDSTAAVPGGSLTLARYALCATGNKTAGYFSGGIDSSVARTTTDKTTYSVETTAQVPGASLTGTRYYLAGTSSSSAGYMGGGLQTTARTWMDKLTYSTDGTASAPGAQLTVANRNGVATSAKADAIPSTTNPVQQFTTGLNPYPNLGYTLGGGSPYTNIIQKFDADTETVTTPPSTLPTTNGFNSAEGDMNAGYSFGGTNPSAPFVKSWIYKITYATEAVSTVSSNLTAARYGSTSSSSTTAGYISGGYTPPLVSRTDKFTYSTETAVYTPGANLLANVGYMGGGGTPTKGYIGGGAGHSRYDKIEYSTDTTNAGPSTFSLFPGSGHRSASAQDGAYFLGGPGLNGTTVEKITYTTDVVTSVPSATAQSPGSSYPYRVSNNDNGYFLGGYGAPQTSSCQKLNIQSETISSIPATISSARYNSMASSPRSYGRTQPPQVTSTAQIVDVPGPTTVAGYIGGGGPGGTRSWMDKTNYSTDGTAAIPSGYLSVAKWQLGATGSTSAGYYGGATGTTGSIMDKCTYSSDTTAAAPGANFVAAKSRYAASSSPSDGYFAAGKNSGSTNISSTEKTTFSSDTTAAAPGSNMTATRYAHGATGNSTQGYYGGGKSPGSSDAATVEKLTYSSGTFSSVPNLDSGARFSVAATPSGTHAYFMGGCQGGVARSWVDKLSYSDDTNSAVPGAFLAAARYNGSATGNSTQGYYYGGWTGSAYVSNTDKITYSGDTTVASPGSNLIAARGYSAASSAGVNGLPATTTIPTPVNC